MTKQIKPQASEIRCNIHLTREQIEHTIWEWEDEADRRLEIVDLNQPYWNNSDDILVVAIDKGEGNDKWDDTKAKWGLEVLGHRLEADEIEIQPIPETNQIAARYWYD